jgi:hypothetical protein
VEHPSTTVTTKKVAEEMIETFREEQTRISNCNKRKSSTTGRAKSNDTDANQRL